MTLAPSDLAALPIFPLPRIALLPHQRLPLHVFEPRYRAMMADCLSRGPRAMAIAQLRPGFEATYEGRPPIFEVAGAGVIDAHHAHANGTFDLMLVGVARVALEELPADGLPYRRARAIVLDDTGAADVVPGDLTALVATAQAIATAVRRVHPDFELAVSSSTDASRAADLVADRFVRDPEVRQKILEATSVAERVRLATEAIAELFAHASQRDGAPSA